ncbi:PREDICTED: ralBP1-associated Eps domain-containing protein 2 isoform X1 [Nanorana parkeri]|uniref:ralBP1-associated Eps domain-containing protein 2 isoform X1 n=1 Tax=Nanorana parkeri TaxID=125878 RepID=UPI000854720E|nr:PREDICTED: ralBP1-associated Eps domain-containing protein 2 isoform X1 [Nanorana parkeri]
MEPGACAAQAAAGLYVVLSDSEQKRYSELFSLCQVEGSPRLAAGSSKVADLFRASQLPAETLHQITELCGAKLIGYFGPAQFFIALKLIAAAQAGLPVSLESIKCELPLACFFSMKSDNSLKYGLSSQSLNSQISNHALSEKGSLHCLFDGETKLDAKTYVTSPQKSSTSSSPKYGHGKIQSSPDHHSGAAYETRHPALLQQDGQLPLNYGIQPAPLQPSLSRQSFTAEREAQDSSDSYSEDPWRITEEQREYYTNQFITLQPDLNSFISGSVAKHFFTKSKLPIPELSHVWDLSDVDCDGALTLAEFCAAFHLIVARKNGFDLPDTLPKNLLSEIIQPASLKPSTDGMYEAYRGTSTVCPIRKELETVCEDPANSEPLILFDVESSNTEPKTTVEVPHIENALKEDSISDLKASQEKLLAPPVATEPKKFSSFKTAVYQDSYPPKTRPRSRSYSSTSIEETMKKVEEPPTPPPRPQKTHSRASSLDLSRIIQQHSPAPRSGWIQPPPALPPRPGVSQIPYQNTNAVPKIPAFADFKSKEQSERAAEIELHPQTNKILPQTEENNPARKEIVLSQPPTKPLRRKFHPESQALENHDLSSASIVTSSAASLKSHTAVQKQPSKQKKAIQTAIRKNKEANVVLARLNSELQQQLKEVHQERIALETQLEQLRPLTVL